MNRFPRLKNFHSRKKIWKPLTTNKIFGVSTKPRKWRKYLKEQLVMIISIDHKGEATIEIFQNDLQKENRQQKNKIAILKGRAVVLSADLEKT